jgi:hypothetical protein
MNEGKITQLILNTINSNNQNSSNPQYYIRQPFDNIVGYSFSGFSGVNSFNVIDSRNNTLQFSESDSSSTIRVITIPTGNYTITSLMASIKTLMDAAGTNTYTVALNSVTNLVTITAATKTFKILTANNHCYYELGFVVSSAFALSQTGSVIYDLSGVKTISIVSNSFGNNSKLINTNYNIVGIVPIEVPFLGVINYKHNPVFIDVQISELSSISFTLLDERGRILNCTHDWSLTLYIQSV